MSFDFPMPFACLMPTLAGWPTSGIGTLPSFVASAEFDVIELPILLPEWQVTALEAAAHERGMTIGQLLRRLFADLFADQRPHTV